MSSDNTLPGYDMSIDHDRCRVVLAVPLNTLTNGEVLGEGNAPLTPEVLAQIGDDLITQAMYAMTKPRQLRQLSLDVLVLANLADDYAKAIHQCPCCGDGPYPEKPYPDVDATDPAQPTT